MRRVGTAGNGWEDRKGRVWIERERIGRDRRLGAAHLRRVGKK